MTKDRATSRRNIAPRLLRRESAAAYIDVCPVTFDKLVKDGVVPAPRRLHSIKAWDIRDLDTFVDHLPYHKISGRVDDSWND